MSSALDLNLVVVGLGILHQRGRGAHLACQELSGFGSQRWVGSGNLVGEGRGCLAVHVPCGAGGSFAQLQAQVAHLGDGAGEQPGDLCFQGSGAHNLPERGIGGQRKQIPGHVEGAGFQRALVGFRLQRLRARNAAAQQLQHCRGGALVGGEEVLDRMRVELGRSRILRKIREIPARFEEILVPRRPLLAVPPLLVHQHDGRQQAQPLHGKGDVGQVGDRAVTVLKVECVEKLLGALGADLGQGFAHRQRGPGVLGHGKGQHFRVGAVDGEYIRLVTCGGGRKSFAGHS